MFGAPRSEISSSPLHANMNRLCFITRPSRLICSWECTVVSSLSLSVVQFPCDALHVEETVCARREMPLAIVMPLAVVVSTSAIMRYYARLPTVGEPRALLQNPVGSCEAFVRGANLKGSRRRFRKALEAVNQVAEMIMCVGLW